MFKKFLCLIAALALVFTLAACNDSKGSNDTDSDTTANAASDTQGSNASQQELEYSLSSDGSFYKVTGLGTVTSENVVIPSSYKGLPVKTVGTKAFANNTSVKSVDIPSSVTIIGDGAFSGCTALTAVFIPSSVENMGRSVFLGCSDTLLIKLQATSIPSAWGDVWNGSNAQVKLGATSISDGASASGTESQGLKFTLSSGAYTVTGIGTCKDTDIVIPKTHDGKPVNAIAKEAFKNCKNVKSITMTSDVTSIGRAAFEGCTSLESLTFPYVNTKDTSTTTDSVYQCFGYLFGTQSCDGTVKVTQIYQYSNTQTKSAAFYIPASLNSVTLLETDAYGKGYTNYTFYDCSMLETVTLYDGASIAKSMFEKCTSLKNVKLPNTTYNQTINQSAFNGCTALESITLPSDIKYIADGAFSRCTSLKSITLPSGLQRIEGRAFESCSALTSISIPSGVSYVGFYAFDGCSSLTTINTNSNSHKSDWNSSWKGDCTATVR